MLCCVGPRSLCFPLAAGVWFPPVRISGRLLFEVLRGGLRSCCGFGTLPSARCRCRLVVRGCLGGFGVPCRGVREREACVSVRGRCPRGVFVLSRRVCPAWLVRGGVGGRCRVWRGCLWVPGSLPGGAPRSAKVQSRAAVRCGCPCSLVAWLSGGGVFPALLLFCSACGPLLRVRGGVRCGCGGSWGAHRLGVRVTRAPRLPAPVGCRSTVGGVSFHTPVVAAFLRTRSERHPYTGPIWAAWAEP